MTIDPHTLACMLGCVFVLGASFGAIGNMVVSRHKHGVVLQQLEEMNLRLAAMLRTESEPRH